MEVAQCPSYAAALGYTGVAAAVCLSNWGSAVRTFPTGILLESPPAMQYTRRHQQYTPAYLPQQTSHTIRFRL
jgi:hypothetical protein